MNGQEHFPEGEQPEQETDEGSRSDVYLSAKLMSSMCAGLTFAANIESIRGMYTASTITLRAAGAAAIGAALGGVAGFIFNRRGN